MKKISLLLIALTGVIVFASCSSEDENVKLTSLTVQLTGTKPDTDFSKFSIKVVESRSGSEFAAQADAKGTATLNLPLGQYDITAEDMIEGASTMYGAVQNFTLSETNKICTIEVKDLQSTLERTFVLDELFFNCSQSSEMEKHYYEEYFTIRNISDRPLFADGLSVAVCGDYNALEDDGEKSVYLKDDRIVASQLYTIPGNGREHLVKPGEALVIAHSAIDHSEGGKHKAAVDLSGADFEIYVPHEYSMTTDNPEVKNLTVNFSTFQAFQWGYSGYAPMMLLKADADLKSYVAEHLVKLKVSGGYGNRKQDYLILPTSWIIDAVETGCKDNFIHKVLPVNVDKSSIQITDDGMYGGFKGQFVKRKAADKGYLQDTNDSEKDFTVIPNGQKSYPKK